MVNDPALWIAVVGIVAAVAIGIWLHRKYPTQTTTVTHALLLDLKNAVASLEAKIAAHLTTATPAPPAPLPPPQPPAPAGQPAVAHAVLDPKTQSVLDEFYASHKPKGSQ